MHWVRYSFWQNALLNVESLKNAFQSNYQRIHKEKRIKDPEEKVKVV